MLAPLTRTLILICGASMTLTGIDRTGWRQFGRMSSGTRFRMLRPVLGAISCAHAVPMFPRICGTCSNYERNFEVDYVMRRNPILQEGCYYIPQPTLLPSHPPFAAGWTCTEKCMPIAVGTGRRPLILLKSLICRWSHFLAMSPKLWRSQSVGLTHDLTSAFC